MKLKGKILATGLCLGISAGFLAMIPTSHHTSAAIAVIDQRNIEEAIKTAIQTAKILTEANFNEKQRRKRKNPVVGRFNLS